MRFCEEGNDGGLITAVCAFPFFFGFGLRSHLVSVFFFLFFCPPSFRTHVLKLAFERVVQRKRLQIEWAWYDFTTAALQAQH